MVEELIWGEENRGYLGVRLDSKSRKVLVKKVVADSPAEAAGLEAGDEIIRYANIKVVSAKHLRLLSMTTGVDSQVAIEVNRDGETLTMDVTISAVPESK